MNDAALALRRILAGAWLTSADGPTVYWAAKQRPDEEHVKHSFQDGQQPGDGEQGTAYTADQGQTGTDQSVPE